MKSASGVCIFYLFINNSGVRTILILELYITVHRVGSLLDSVCIVVVGLKVKNGLQMVEPDRPLTREDSIP